MTEVEDIPYIEVLADWSNPIWRIETIYWVLTDEGVEMPFRLRPEQRQYMHNLWHRNLTLKSRQHGFTTFIQLLQLDSCIFIPNFKALTIAETLPKAMEIFRTKILYPWRKLPQDLRDQFPLEAESKTELIWKNGSSISVGVSGRSGTLQSLHVSEFGPIAAKWPEKAREIVTGSFEAVTQSTGMIHIESTGKGRAGRFYDLADKAIKDDQAQAPMTPLDFRLHFFAWWQKKANVLDPTYVLITREMGEYFTRLQLEHQIFLTPEQKAWYAKKAEALGEDMKSEHPSYPEEAFEVVIEGAILGKEMTWLRKMKRIGVFPWEPRLPVNTFWDFGVGDATSIWFHQRVRGLNRMIGNFTDANQGLGYYVNEMNSRGYVWGTHFIPHDGDARMQTELVTTKKKELKRLGLGQIKVVPRVATIEVGINLLRSEILKCEFDAVGCADGIRALDQYQREWDEKLERWGDKPRHDWASNPVDALRQMAQGYNPDRDRRVGEIREREVLEPEVGH